MQPEATLGQDRTQDTYHSVPETGNAAGVGLPVTKAEASLSPLEQETPPLGTPSYWTAKWRKTIVQGCYLVIGAILGTFLRMVLAQLFGQECANPGTVGWLASEAALCVTADGETDQVGGIVFADLPANMLGCFIMGFMQDGKVLDLAIHAPMAWLAPESAFQGWDVVHLAIKTGFCGSLTTFSSWNSEMVVMMVGQGATTQLHSQVFRAIFGFIIGIETALGSYVFGRTVACWVHKFQCPALAVEAEAMEERKLQGVSINHALPEFERQYLHNLDISGLPDSDISEATVAGLPSLEKWRESTRGSRMVGSESVEILIEVETAVLVEGKPILDDLVSTSHKYGWDIGALRDYCSCREDVISPDLTPAGIRRAVSEEEARFFQAPYAMSVVALVLVILVILLSTLNSDEIYEVTDRTMVYSMFFSGPGALLRWKLSGFNGKFPLEEMGWLPAGTLAANVLGSMLSICMISTEYRVDGGYSSFWLVATLRAIKVGLCGCLTTVSTFISEVHGFALRKKQDLAYKYIVISLVTSSVLGMALFSMIVYL